MTWCARCDVLTTEAAGEACPSCGEPILDPIRPSRRQRAGIQILEADAPPTVEVAAAPVAPALPDQVAPRVTGQRFSRRVIVGALVLALAGTGVGFVTRDNRPTSKASASATASSTPTSASLVPPLGKNVVGWVVFPTQRGFDRLDLSSGFRDSVELDVESFALAVASRTRRVAYVDDARILYTTDHNGNSTRAVTADVDTFAWTQNGDALIVSRSVNEGRSAGRFRIELFSVDDRIPLLLAEGSSQVVSVASRSGRHFATLSRADGPHVYEIAPGVQRLIRSGAVLMDVSPDGQRALISTTAGKPSLLLVDVDSRKATRVGPKSFLPGSAAFSADGARVALTGTPHFTMETGGCDGEGSSNACPPFPLPSDQIVWILDVKTLALRSLHAFPADSVGTPAWGPEGWLLIGSENHAYALPVSNPSASMIELTDGVAQDWPTPQYIA